MPPAVPEIPRAIPAFALAAVLAISALGCAAVSRSAGASSARPLGADDLRLDLEPAREVLGLWTVDGNATETSRVAERDTRQRAVRLATSAPYRILRDFQRDQNRCVISDDEMLRVLLHPDSTHCGISLDPAFRERAKIDSLLRQLSQDESAFRSRIAADAARYLPRRGSWRPVGVRFILASRWSFDAITTIDRYENKGDPVILLNATEVLGYGPSTRERMEVLAHVLAHETFHAGLRQVEPQLPGWASYPQQPRSMGAHILRVMLDEGVAHYVDWKGRPGADTLFVSKPGYQERRSFDQLQIAVRRLSDRNLDFGARSEILQLASNGPLWSKYGAISGMFAAYRIESRLGADSLRAAVVGGPTEFLRMYRGVSAADSSLLKLPAELGR